ncbi:MoaD/ThiS family protein [Isachenkonia alkalipeptolytica]|uniref:MoaD/ThiS family protein n=1 Tax=Isachenkonia alkalipeptolytica TaxID=2565777 RepID=A0AA44BCK1_9CLOT|nr:MoaD/ThiS family protein [Isachenkonia alkalipeptolytica]NBG86998.1 MoaD/ThiS family protein [Isachenkonia alkalipeptolytica]
MEIQIKLFATLREGRGKLVTKEFSSAVTPKEVLEALNINEEDVAILLVNGLDGTLDQELQDGDMLSVFPPVGGG